MTQYLHAEQFEKMTPLPGSGVSDIHERYRHYSGLSFGRLIMVFERFSTKIAVDVSGIQDFIEFEGQYKQGYILDREFYTLPFTNTLG